MVNPIIGFYEVFLAFFQGMPIAFQAFFGLAWGLVIFFALMSLVLKL